VFHVHIAETARSNDSFRQVLSTSARSQVVVMTLQPGEDLSDEFDDRADTVLTIVEGTAVIEVDGEVLEIGPGSMVVMPAATRHNLTNTGTEPLRLHGICTPPVYVPGTLHETRTDAVGVSQPPPAHDLSALQRFDMSDPHERSTGIAVAVAAVARGELVVLPTDTVYGLGGDALRAEVVADLRRARDGDPHLPVPVLVGSVAALEGLTSDLSNAARNLVGAFWPGGLTLVCRVGPSLQYAGGNQATTVAVRMPGHPVALDLLAATGPMAVSGANRVGSTRATTVDAAIDQLGASVAVYLDGGEADDPTTSTIVDVTGSTPRLLREGAVPEGAIRAAIGDLAVEGVAHARGQRP